jgi:hypothetical protein
VLVNPANPSNMETTLNDVEAGARGKGLQIQIHNVGTKRDIDAAFATFVNHAAGPTNPEMRRSRNSLDD